MNPSSVPLVSIVIPAFKRTESLARAIRSLYQQELPAEQFEVFVADSSPDSNNRQLVEEMQAEAPFRLQYLHKQPEGPGPSRNLGAHHASAEILAFLDSDCEASPNWLREGVAAFEPSTGLVQGQTAPDPSAKLGALVHTVVVDRANHIFEACNIFYRRQAFEQAAGFPQEPDLHALHETPMGGEDVELAWKVKRLGWESHFAPGAVVYHAVVPIRPIQWLYGNRLIIWPRVVKRYPEIRKFFYARVFYDRAQALFSLGLLGLACAWISPWFLALGLPYVYLRATEDTNSLRGAKRVLRVCAYGLKDAVSFGVLVIGSIRFKSPLI